MGLNMRMFDTMKRELFKKNLMPNMLNMSVSDD